MATNWDDADYGLTPREWLENDAVPLTPDVDFSDPVQRSAWMRANNEENRARWLELQARRKGGGRRARGAGDADATADADAETDADGGRAMGAVRSVGRMSATSVVGVRVLNAEQRALVRLARREGVSVSDLVRRWVRAGLDWANGAESRDELAEVDREIVEEDEQVRREAMVAAADAMVERIGDEVRRLREIVVSGG